MLLFVEVWRGERIKNTHYLLMMSCDFIFVFVFVHWWFINIMIVGVSKLKCLYFIDTFAKWATTKNKQQRGWQTNKQTKLQVYTKQSQPIQLKTNVTTKTTKQKATRRSFKFKTKTSAIYLWLFVIFFSLFDFILEYASFYYYTEIHNFIFERHWSSLIVSFFYFSWLLIIVHDR